MDTKKVILLILDGWGIGNSDTFNAIENADTPNFDRVIREYPDVRLKSDGESVGLPKGQSGTSEINHMVIGAGKVVIQDMVRIDNAIENGQFFENRAFQNLIDNCRSNDSSFHIVGIMSEGGVHSKLEHTLELIELAKKEGLKRVFVHAFTDGRDTSPMSAEKYLQRIQEKLDESGFEKSAIASIQGRFFLDRDRQWEVTDEAVDLLTTARGDHYKSFQTALNYFYNHNTTDEFIPQVTIDESGVILAGDSVVFTHYRSDRMYQIQKRLLEKKIKDVKYASFISAFESAEVDIAFPRPVITHTLARSVSEAGKKQIHITETEKYTHLTYFFNAGREDEYPGEEWVLFQSNRFVKPFYSLAPSMSVTKITEKVLKCIEEDAYDLILVNYPNTDMVGHTGNYHAAIVAAEAVDHAIGKIIDATEERLEDYALIITADHGNAEEMWDYKNKQPHTRHTLNPVPMVLVSDIDCTLKKRESLEDIAPTILSLMGIEKPATMTGEDLIIPK